MFRKKREFRWQAAAAMRLGLNSAASPGYIDALLPTTPLVAAPAFWQAIQRLGCSTLVTISRSLNYNIFHLNSWRKHLNTGM